MGFVQVVNRSIPYLDGRGNLCIIHLEMLLRFSVIPFPNIHQKI